MRHSRHDRSVGLERLTGMPCGTDRVGHIVQTVEERNEIEAMSLVADGGRQAHGP
jgi:hypothetical protein